MMPRSFLPIAMLAATLLLSACESAEEKAEGYYQSALSLMEEGDVDRALLELRNVFEYDGFHKEARQLYADTLFERGDIGTAYSQYLRLVEQYPDIVDARLTLAEIALSRNDWDQVERHGNAAAELAADAPRTRAIQAALDYRESIVASGNAGQAEAIEMARAVLDDMPENLVARRLVIADALSGNDPISALPDIEIALEQDPNRLEFQVAKFQVLNQSGRTEEAGAQLEAMYALFPENEDVRTTLVRWYVAQGDQENTERLLRDLAGDLTDAPEGHLTVVQFLLRTQGIEAAHTELDRLIEANDGSENRDLYLATKASILFESGEQTAAITQMQDIISGAEATDQTQQIKVILARMLIQTGDQVGARALIEEVLAEDTANVDALKIRAAWRIQDDDPDAAIVDLRTAADQSPRDAEILTLMAQAHDRAGSPELAVERLALAVEVSNSAPEQSLRYAEFLIRENQRQTAEGALTISLRNNPGNLDLISALAEIRLDDQNWPAVNELLQMTRQIDGPEAEELAVRIEAALLVGQDRLEDGLALLETQLEQGDIASTAIVIVQAQVAAGRIEEARAYLDDALLDDPENSALILLNGSLNALEGDLETSEALFRDVLTREPQSETPVRLLVRLLFSQGRVDEATVVLEDAIERMPNAQSLLVAQAGLLERAGQFEEAIAIYQTLYDQDTSNIVLANNLASMLATRRTDQESLEQAYAIARRLRSIEEPAFQDTYGWIESRLGNYEDALVALEPAAEGLPNDPLVQYHLGMTYAGLERTEEAIAALTRALELAGDSDLPQFDVARETIAELQAAE